MGSDTNSRQIVSELKGILGNPVGVMENYLMCGKPTHLVSEVKYCAYGSSVRVKGKHRSAFSNSASNTFVPFFNI